MTWSLGFVIDANTFEHSGTASKSLACTVVLLAGIKSASIVDEALGYFPMQNFPNTTSRMSSV